jgi:hypothetical protein
MTKAERREHEEAAIEHLREAGYDVRFGCHPEHPLVEVVTIEAVPFTAHYDPTREEAPPREAALLAATEDAQEDLRLFEAAEAADDLLSATADMERVERGHGAEAVNAAMTE